MNRNAIVLTAFLAIATLLVPTQLASFDSDADEELIDSNIWICYGRNISIRDHNYDEKTYSSIEWRYSTVKADLDTMGPVKNVVLEFSVPFEICADDTYITYYVRESAVVGGTPLTEDLTVLINPSSYVRYVKFMYNDGTDTTYYNAPVTSEKGYKYGTQYLADPPAKDPVRPGYRFDGWYCEASCETPYDKSYYHLFDSSRITHLYAKWVGDPSFQPGYDMVKIDLQPVDGLRFAYDGLVIPQGTNFTYTATTFKGYAYDLSGSRSLCVTDGRTLDKTPDGDGYRFTLVDVEQDSTVILTGMQRMYYIYDTLHDGIRMTPYTSPSSGSLNLTLSLPSGSQYNAIETTVWMGGENVTGNVVSGNDISIPNLTGDVYIFADGKSVEKHDDFPWWIVALAGAIIAALLAAMAFLLRKKKAVLLSSSGTSCNALASKDFSGKTCQFLDLSKSRDMDPAYAFLFLGKDSYMRSGYRFEAKGLPAGVSMSEDGTITGRIAADQPSGAPGTFTVTAVDLQSGKKVCTGEFRYTVSE